MNDSSREGYADDWDDPELGKSHHRPHHMKPFHRTGAGLATAANLNTRQIPPELPETVRRYQTPGPGPSAGIPKRDLELSKLEKTVEDIKLIIRPWRSSKAASDIVFELSKIERSIANLKGDTDA